MATQDIFEQVDQAIDSTDFIGIHQQKGALPDNLKGRVQKVVQIYNGIKPLLTAATKVPLFPMTWKTALAILIQALDALVSAPDLAGAGAGGDFKAGKDI
jgi:hypothetical protein